MMKIRCPNCQKIFNADFQQEQLINSANLKNQRLVIIECPECYKDVPINPKNLLSKEPQKDEMGRNNITENITCPICGGIVSYIDDEDEKFWGCGECGNVWFSKDELEKAISNKK